MTDSFAERNELMPALFAGHGNPMYAIEENEFTAEWSKLGLRIPKPEAVLCISAHWETGDTYVTSSSKPETIHDFYGFPDELFDVRYSASGAPALAELILERIKFTKVKEDAKRGLDHGCWALLKNIYPDAGIPVVQLSIDVNQPAEWHYQLGKELGFLRRRGVLILGSGNMIHNLRLVNWRDRNAAYDWALEINGKFKQLIIENKHTELINYSVLGSAALLAAPTPEHYLPMLYILGMKEEEDKINFFNDKIDMGSLSMTSFIIG